MDVKSDLQLFFLQMCGFESTRSQELIETVVNEGGDLEGIVGISSADDTLLGKIFTEKERKVVWQCIKRMNNDLLVFQRVLVKNYETDKLVFAHISCNSLQNHMLSAQNEKKRIIQKIRQSGAKITFVEFQRSTLKSLYQALNTGCTILHLRFFFFLIT